MWYSSCKPHAFGTQKSPVSVVRAGTPVLFPRYLPGPNGLRTALATLPQLAPLGTNHPTDEALISKQKTVLLAAGAILEPSQRTMVKFSTGETLRTHPGAPLLARAGAHWQKLNDLPHVSEFGVSRRRRESHPGVVDQPQRHCVFRSRALVLHDRPENIVLTM